MRSRRLRLLRNERGIAMVTVLFIGAALTAVTSVAAIAAVQEFRAGNDDRRAVGALAYAEAGVDRMINMLRTGQLNFGELNKLGCSIVPLELRGAVGTGTFKATMTVYNPNGAPAANRFPVGTVPTTGGACTGRPTSPHPGQDGQDNTFFVIVSEGRHPAAARVVRQVIALTPLKLPIGIYANTVSVQSQNHEYAGISMVSKTSITSRNLLSFSGRDSYYKMSDFYENVTGAQLSDPAYAAAHSEGTIFVRTFGGLGSNTPEFQGGTNTKNCSANGTAGGAAASNSIWDSDRSAGAGPISSGCTGNTTGYPSSSVFSAEKAANFAKPELTEQDHQTLAEAARTNGVFCSFPGTGAPASDDTSTCFVRGVQMTNASPDWMQIYIDGLSDGLAAYTTEGPINDFVAYAHFRYGSAQSNTLLRPVRDVWGCSDDPAVHRSVVLVVKGGGITYTGAGGSRVNGAFIFDGDWAGSGQLQFNGSLISKGNVSFLSSSQTFTTDPCWVRNMPGSFLQTVQGHWSEVDR